MRHAAVGDDQHRLVDRIEHLVERRRRCRDRLEGGRREHIAIFADRHDQHRGRAAEEGDEHRLRATAGQQDDERRQPDGAERDEQTIAEPRGHIAFPLAQSSLTRPALLASAVRM